MDLMKPWSYKPTQLEKNRGDHYMDPSKRVCPECAGPVEADLGCHTWPRNVTRQEGTDEDGNPRYVQVEQYMACMPCDSATIWSCETRWMDGDELRALGKKLGRKVSVCEWSWTEDLNPGNPRYAENETRNPHWDLVEEDI